MERAYIVDDHSDTADIIQAILQSSGYAAEAFTTFDACLNHLVPDSPCIVFMDYNVPCAMKPAEFINEVRRRFPDLKIVIISGDPRTQKKAEELNTKFILKPFDLDELRALCAEHCDANKA